MNASRRPKRVAIYARVSTANGQTTKNQERELQVVAKRHDWQVVEVYRDKGISGAKGAISAPDSTSCWQRSPARRSTWSPPGQWTAWAAR